jgi:predicted transcriptional regulator
VEILLEAPTESNVMPRVRRTTEAASIKLTPEVRRAWAGAAEAERRSPASVFEVAILKHVKRHHMAVPAAAKEEQPRED